jgi:hypothetical protein
MSKLPLRIILFWAFTLAVSSSRAQEATPEVSKPNVPLADIKMADPSIVIELRYASSDNIAGHPLYPPGTVALVRPELVPRLVAAEKYLRRYDYRLKIWDAYRPKSVQAQLWEAAHNNEFPALAPVHFTPGGSRSMSPWPTPLSVPSACRPISIILRPPLRGNMSGKTHLSARIYICSRSQCATRASMACGVSGGISPSQIGRNTCRRKKRSALRN